jgi:hypothetical protein
LPIPDKWQPQDAKLLENNILLIVGDFGLSCYDLNPDISEVTFNRILERDFYRIALSHDGRIVGVAGKSRDLFLFEASSMKPITKVATGNTCDIRMTSNHIFLKQADRTDGQKGWIAVSLKESAFTKTIDGMARMKEIP